MAEDKTPAGGTRESDAAVMPMLTELNGKLDGLFDGQKKNKADFEGRMLELKKSHKDEIEAVTKAATEMGNKLETQADLIEKLQKASDKRRFGLGDRGDTMLEAIPKENRPWISRIAGRFTPPSPSTIQRELKVQDAQGQHLTIGMELHTDSYRKDSLSHSLGLSAQRDPVRLTLICSWLQSFLKMKWFAARAMNRESEAERIAMHKMAFALGGYPVLKDNGRLVELPSEERALGDIDLTEGVNAEGGFLVPVEVWTEIEKLMRDSSIVRMSGARVLPMRTEKLTLPRRDTVPVVYWPAEGAAPSDDVWTAGPFAGPQLNSEKQIGLQLITMELVMDNVANVVDFVFEDIVREMGTQEDLQAFQGTGAPFTGLASVSGIGADVTKTPAVIAAVDWLNLIFAIKHRDVLDNGVVHCHPNVLKDLMALTEANNRPYLWGTIFPNLFQGQGQSFLQKKIYTSGIHSQTLGGGGNETFPYHGNVRGLAFGDRMDFALDINDRADTPFKQGQAWLRVLRRVAFVVWVPGLWARHQDIQVTTT